MADDEVPQVVIVRYGDSWCIMDLGSHHIRLPWKADAPATSVISWLKTRANGQLKVKVDLG